MPLFKTLNALKVKGSKRKSRYISKYLGKYISQYVPSVYDLIDLERTEFLYFVRKACSPTSRKHRVFYRLPSVPLNNL